MSTPTIGTTRSRLRTKVAVASAAVAAAGVVSALALTGSAQAGSNDRPAVTFNTIGPSPTIGTSPPFTFVTVAPTYGPPSPTLGTLPPITLITVFPPASTDATTTTEATETTETSGTTDVSDTTPGSGPSQTTSTSATSPGGPTEGFTLDITNAQINCDGMIHVEYATTANPEPLTDADHLVVFNPTSNPVDFHVVETVGNAPNGSFTFEQLGSIDDTYRVFVITLFDSADLEGPKLIDEADVLLAPGC